jgi:hypothetical protein
VISRSDKVRFLDYLKVESAAWVSRVIAEIAAGDYSRLQVLYRY